MPQPPPPPPPPPPLAIDADRRALHDLGYLELTKVPEWELLRVRVMRVRPMFACAWVLPYGLLKTSRGYNKGKPAHSASPEPDPHPTKVPDWELLAFCEMMHTRWHKRCAELLDGLRARWFEGCDEGARVGAVAARVATELLDEELFEAGGTHGIWLTPTPNPNPNPNPSPNPNPNPNPDPNPNPNPKQAAPTGSGSRRRTAQSMRSRGSSPGLASTRQSSRRRCGRTRAAAAKTARPPL